jgi:hypothetical protein
VAYRETPPFLKLLLRTGSHRTVIVCTHCSVNATRSVTVAGVPGCCCVGVAAVAFRTTPTFHREVVSTAMTPLEGAPDTRAATFIFAAASTLACVTRCTSVLLPRRVR